MLNPLNSIWTGSLTIGAPGLTRQPSLARWWTAGTLTLGLCLVGGAGAIAQTANSGASLLQTQPATLQASASKRSDRAIRLNQVADTIQAQTTPKSTATGLLSKVTTPQKPTTVDPLDFFRVPGMEGSVKLPLAK
jgi:hypothetical protein